MNRTWYTVNDRNYSALLALEDECKIDPRKNCLFELPCLALVNVTGERAAELLQGQLSCDLRQVNPGEMRQGALCNLKGRVQALLYVINWQGYQLVLPDDLVSSTLNSLGKAALLSRVSLQQNHDYQVYGFYLGNQSALPPALPNLPLAPFAVNSTDVSCCFAIGDGYYLILVSNDNAALLYEPFLSQQQMRGSLGWHRLQLERQHVQLYPRSSGLFLAHRMDLHKTGFISFDKGCYKGQEIIARTQYRAKLKHQLKKFIIHTQEPLYAGTKLINMTDNTEAGELIDFCPIAEETCLIVASILHEHPQAVIIEGQHNPVTLGTCP